MITRSDATPPLYVTIERARQELGNCSRTYVYELLGKGVLRSTNPGGGRRLIEFASIQKLLHARPDGRTINRRTREKPEAQS